MKKFFLIFSVTGLLVVCLGVFVLPYGLGFLIQDKYRHLFQATAHSPIAKLTLKQYHRGWFSSVATIEVAFPAVKGGPTQTWLLHQEIQHGPVFSFLTNTGKKQLGMGQGAMKSKLLPTFNNPASLPQLPSPPSTTPPHTGQVTLLTWIKWDGTIANKVQAASLQLDNPIHHQIITLKNLSGTFSLSPHFDHIIAHLSIPVVTITTPPFKNTLDHVQLHYDLHKSPSGLFLGKHTFLVNLLIAETPHAAEKMIFNQIYVASQEQEHNQKMYNNAHVVIQQVTWGQTQVGPQEIRFSIRHLDLPSLLELKQALLSLQTTPQPISMDLLKRYSEKVFKILNKGVEVEIQKATFVSPWGSPSFSGKITLPPQSQPKKNSMLLLMDGTISAQAHVPAIFLFRMLEKFYILHTTQELALAPPGAREVWIQQQILHWVNQKWLLPQGNGYKVQFLYQQGRATLNDQPL